METGEAAVEGGVTAGEGTINNAPFCLTVNFNATLYFKLSPSSAETPPSVLQPLFPSPLRKRSVFSVPIPLTHHLKNKKIKRGPADPRPPDGARPRGRGGGTGLSGTGFSPPVSKFPYLGRLQVSRLFKPLRGIKQGTQKAGGVEESGGGGGGGGLRQGEAACHLPRPRPPRGGRLPSARNPSSAFMWIYKGTSVRVGGPA